MKGKQSHRPVWNGRRVANDMMAAGFTQRTLARKAGVTESTVSRLINGLPVSAHQVGKVARVFKTTPDRYLDSVAIEPSKPGLSLSA